jgi:hypothetical protein
MPVIVKLKFGNEADAEAVLLELATDERVRAADSTVTLPDGEARWGSIGICTSC